MSPAYSGAGATHSEHASPTGLSPAVAGRSRPLRLTLLDMRDMPRTSPTTPAPYRDRFGLFPVRSPLLGESRLCFLFLWLLSCLSSPGWPLFAEVPGHN